MKLIAYSSPIQVAQAAFRHGMSIRGGAGASVISPESKTAGKYTRALDSGDGYTRTFMPHGLQHGKMPAGGSGQARTVSRGYGVLIADGQSIHTFSKVADLGKHRPAPKIEQRVSSRKATKLYKHRASANVKRVKMSRPQPAKRDWRVDNQRAVERFAKIAKTTSQHVAPKERYSIVPQIATLHSPPTPIAGIAPMQLGTLTTNGDAQALAQAQVLEVSQESA